MKILNAKIDWQENYDVYPKLQVLIDEIPKVKYQKKNGLFYGENEGYVNFMYQDNTDKRGFGGRSFTLDMVDGSQTTLVGPWSSRDTAVNLLGFGPCIGVDITTKPKSFERGFTFFAGAITLEAAKKAAKIAKCKLVKVTYNDGEFTWIPAPLDFELDEIKAEWSKCDFDQLRKIKKGHYYREKFS